MSSKTYGGIASQDPLAKPAGSLMGSLIEQLQRGVDTNEPPDKTDRIMTLAADKIEKLLAALEEIADGNSQSCIYCQENTMIARKALVK